MLISELVSVLVVVYVLRDWMGTSVAMDIQLHLAALQAYAEERAVSCNEAELLPIAGLLTEDVLTYRGMSAKAADAQKRIRRRSVSSTNETPYSMLMRHETEGQRGKEGRERNTRDKVGRPIHPWCSRCWRYE